jgi:hypothetical protein
VPPENRFWFGQHVAAMLAYVRLPGRSAVPYRGDDVHALIDQAAWFILRGFGLTDAAIAANPPPPRVAPGDAQLLVLGDA